MDDIQLGPALRRLPPSEGWRAVADSIRRRANADLCLCGRFVRADAVRVARVTVSGMPQAVATLGPMEGGTVVELGLELPTAAPLDSLGHLILDDASVGDGGAVWRRLGVADALGGIISHDDQLVGFVMVARAPTRGGFTALEVTALSRMVRTFRRWMVTLDQRDEDGGHFSGDLVLSPKGRVLWFEPGADEVEGLFDAAARCVARGDRAEGDHLQGGHLLHLSRLSGSAGAAWLVRCEPTTRVAVDPFLRLSPLKRGIAQRAAQGRTVQEVATAVGRSEETVRSHLKRIYEVLEVANRVELADCLQRVWS